MGYRDKIQSKQAKTEKYRQVDLYGLIRLKPRKDSEYNKDDVLRAAKAMIVYGVYERAAEEVGIPSSTIRYWASRDWWPILIEELKFLHSVHLDGMYTKLLDKSLEVVQERLENGDEVVVGKEIRRKKVSARDAAIIAALMFDKRQIARGDPTSIQQKNFSVDDRLASLQETFEKLARRENEKVVEGTIEKEVALIEEAIGHEDIDA